ncbi:hypothetical protein ACHAW6_012304 [Cyclotella cf. meneghiniana]
MLAVPLIFLVRLHCALSVPVVKVPNSKLDQEPHLRLIPAKTMPPLPPLSDKKGRSSGYHGCLGLSADELAKASKYFQDEMPPCVVYVNDTVVVGNDSASSGSSSNGGSSSGSGGSSSGSGGSSSGSGGSSSGSGGSSSGSGGSSSGSGDSTGGSSEGGSSGGSGSGSNGGSSEGGSSGGSGSGSSGGSSDGSSNESSGGSDSESSGGYDSGSSGNNDRSNNDDGGGSSNGNSSGSTNDDGDYGSPLVYFNISDCGSYSNLWMWDLALSCDNSTSFHNCKCTSAEILFQYGTLECPGGSSGAPSCPSGCPICSTCMDLLGCVTKIPGGKRTPVNIPVNLERTVNRTLPLVLGIAAGVASLLAGVAAHRFKNRNNGKSSVGTLNSALVDERDQSSDDADAV